MAKKVFKIENGCCPKCGAGEFISEPNQYDVLTFLSNQFEIINTEPVNDFKIFCRECGVEIKYEK